MIKAKEVVYKISCVPYSCVVEYLMNIGIERAKKITDEQIESINESQVMSAEFARGVVSGARALARECNVSDIVRLIKAEWCCAGEVYDPDLGQYVTDLEYDEE